MSTLDSIFVDLIDLELKGPGRWLGPPAPEVTGTTYGGQFLAQGLAAAYQTLTKDRRIHSLHAYFVRGGDVAEPTTYEVETIRDGRSFSTRAVVADQGHGELFRMMMSFHVSEPGLNYQAEVAHRLGDLPPPDQVRVDYTLFSRQHPDIGDNPDWTGDARPIEIRYINSPPQPERSGHPPLAAVEEPQLMWQRIDGRLGDNPQVHDCGVAYLSDSTLVDHVMLPHGGRWQDHRLNGTSLDHVLWFHRPTMVDQWLLYDQRVEATGGGRGLVTGRLYDRKSRLVATVSQEGLMRWRW